MIQAPDELKNYSITCNEVARRNDLSAKAKGIYFYLATLPPRWKLRQNELYTHFSEGKDALRTGFQELINAGYIQMTDNRNDKGQLIGKNYKILWQAPKQDETGTPQSHEKPISEQPIAENPISADPQLLNTKTTTITDLSKTPHSPPASGREAGELKPILDNLSTATKDLPVDYKKIKLTKKYELLPLSFRQEVEAVISYLNSAAAKNYRCSSTPALKLLLARFKEGFTVTDMKRVIDSKVSEWKDNPEMNKHLRPTTLFCPKHFETYLDEAPAQKHKKEIKQVLWEERKRATFIKNAVNKIQEEKGLPKYKTHTDIPGGYEQYAHLVPESALCASQGEDTLRH